MGEGGKGGGRGREGERGGGEEMREVGEEEERR